jgi:hypothetical protein
VIGLRKEAGGGCRSVPVECPWRASDEMQVGLRGLGAGRCRRRPWRARGTGEVRSRPATRDEQDEAD